MVERRLVFLCHATEDKPRVRGLYHRLRESGLDPWLDEEEILPGSDWELEIRRALQASKHVLVCLSEASVGRKGYVQKEIRMALDVLDQMPEGHVFLIPVRLDECQVPERLSHRQWVNLFETGGREFDRLLKALVVSDAPASPGARRRLPTPGLARVRHLHGTPASPTAASASEEPTPETLNGQRQMVSPYSPGIPKESLLRLKGQLHCHWYDDGQLPGLLGLGGLETPLFDLTRKPVEVARRYHELGYDFLAFTEHNAKEVIKYTREHPGYGTPGSCLVGATSEVQTPPLFIEILQSEELTAARHHVLAFGVRRQITQRDCQNDPPFAPLAEAVVQREGGVAFLPHPRAYLGGAAYTDFHQQLTTGGSKRTLFSAMSVRTAASALFWKDSLCLWDVLLNQEIWTQTAEGRAILLPAYAEDDYTPLGMGPVEILCPGSTWIEIEVDRRAHPWPEPEEDANGQRSAALLTALQSGRWWTYWVQGCHPWPTDRAYPRLSLRVDETRQEVTVTSDKKLSSLSFITRLGMTHPFRHDSVPAGTSVTYPCQGDEVYVRVAAEYEDSGLTLRVYSNPVWVPGPAAPAVAPVAPPPPPAEPEIALAEALPVLRGDKQVVKFRVKGEVIHAPVRLDKRVVGYAKPASGQPAGGELWQAEIDVGSYPSGTYPLQLEVVDRQGRAKSQTWEAHVQSEAAASAVSVDRGSLPTTPQIAPVRLTGKVSPIYAGARLAALVVRVDRLRTYRAEVQGEGWSCWILAESFTRGLHTLEATALYARTSRKAELTYMIG